MSTCICWQGCELGSCLLLQCCWPGMQLQCVLSSLGACPSVGEKLNSGAQSRLGNMPAFHDVAVVGLYLSPSGATFLLEFNQPKLSQAERNKKSLTEVGKSASIH